MAQKNVGNGMLQEVRQALKEVQDKGWGSVEIYIQNHKVTQITSRNIKKTSDSLTS